MTLEQMILTILDGNTQGLSVSSFYQALWDDFQFQPDGVELNNVLRDLYHQDKVQRLSVRNDINRAGFYVYFDINYRTINSQLMEVKKSRKESQHG